ncbi:MAG: hypothetical protein QM628_14200 [Propionicimonas sp.]
MPDADFAETGRAATALRSGLRQRAELPAFRPLDVTELVTGPARPSRPSRWINLGVAVAAIGAAIALLLPQGLGGGSLPATPMQSPTPATTPPRAPVVRGTWQATAPSPLSPRRDAVAAWVDGSYLISGGIAEPSCPNDEGQPDCPDPRQLSDGARYDPTTDSWSGIAPAPQPIFAYLTNPYPKVAVLGRTMYVLQSDALLAYDMDADRWDSLPAPEEAVTLMAADAVLVGYPWGESGRDDVRYETFDPATGTWTSHAPDAETPSAVTGASVVANRLVISSLPDGRGDTLSVLVIDLATGQVRELNTPVPGQRPSSVVVGGLVAWPRGDQDEGSDPGDRRAWFLDPVTEAWTSVALPEESSGLSGRNQRYERDWYITTDAMVALRGQFYDPVAQGWSEVPALPVPADDPIVVGGADSVLVCYGEDALTFVDACYLLRPAFPVGIGGPAATPSAVPPSNPPPSEDSGPGADLPNVAPEASVPPEPPSSRPPGR